ncbi:hypothetical protein RCH33_937 [Flavobacterium daejeonense]|nr:hypothetical protein RCH33_937 [Flavobacterium daejeonense]
MLFFSVFLVFFCHKTICFVRKQRVLGVFTTKTMIQKTLQKNNILFTKNVK